MTSQTDSDSYESSSSCPEPNSSRTETPGANLFCYRVDSDDAKIQRSMRLNFRNHLEKGITRDKRATFQQVLDRRTILRLYKLHGQGVFTCMHGVLSSGKEANVYLAQASTAEINHLAIKIYNTSILVFRDRCRYLEGEFRFRRGYVGTKNPRKMVSQWAEKEFRNLKRISVSGLHCPLPIALKDHIVVMELIHDGQGNTCPILQKLGALPTLEWQLIYIQTIAIMRVLYQQCKLIHADFSPYNLIYQNGKVYVIDVSQALEHDHPNADYFLRRDVAVVTLFFSKVSCLETPDYKLRLDVLSEAQLHYYIVGDYQLPSSLDKCNNYVTLASIRNVNSIAECNLDDIVDASVLDTFDAGKFNFLRRPRDCQEHQVPEFGPHTRAIVLQRRIRYYQLLHTMWKLFNFHKSFLHQFLSPPDTLSLAEALNTKASISVNAADSSQQQSTLNGRFPSGEFVDIPPESHYNESQGDATSACTSDDIVDYDCNGNEAETTPNGSRQFDALETNYDCLVPANVKFTGRIPAGMCPKLWKRLVKEHNRQRRLHKLPKHIKKSKTKAKH